MITMKDYEKFVWAEKYRPKTLSDVVLPNRIKDSLSQSVEAGEVQDSIFYGPPGIGKTTAARALVNDLGAEYLFIEASMRGNIDTLRNDITEFASTSSLVDGRKYVILDEADFLNPQSTQPALRNFIDKYSATCGFILTANYPNRILDAVKSRCISVDFSIRKDEKKDMGIGFLRSLESILENEDIEYDRKVLGKLILKNFPDWRQTLNQLQKYSSDYGRIDVGILSASSGPVFDALFEYLKDKKFTDMRKWVSENMDIPTTEFYTTLYRNLEKRTQSPVSYADAVVILAEYQYQESMVANAEINRVAALAVLMADVEWC